MTHPPTPEQAAIVDAAASGADLVVEAGAGTGKTSTLRLVAARLAGKRGVYLAYNKAIQVDAARAFPVNVLCKTAHSLAYAAVGRQYAHRLRAPRMPARETARILGLNDPVQLDKDRAPLAPQQLARLVMETVQRFCYSADNQLQRTHVPLVNGIDSEPHRADLAGYLVPVAQAAWDQHIAPLDGRLRFSHDCYLKLWAMSGPQLGADYVLLDEAQDSNPCVAALVTGQHAQRIWVGDRSQAIYGWRGAVDAMEHAPGLRLLLSQSFRFGPAVADEANKWLAVLGARLRLRGFDRIASQVVDTIAADAVLCRTNAEAVRQCMAYTTAGARTALVGGGKEIQSLAEAALELRGTGSTAHPELCAFASWSDVIAYVEEDSAGSDLQVAVRLIDTYGPEQVIAILGRLVPEDHADVVISTAHKAKGREWPRVQIADDFREPKTSEDNPNPRIPREDAMLAYVAVTRARQVLGRQGLAWVDRWTPKTATPPFRPLAQPEPPDDWPDDEIDQIEAHTVPAPATKPATDSMCLRCCSPRCICDPAAAARWSAITGLFAGSRT